MAYNCRKRYPKKQIRTIDQQIVNMHANFPDFTCNRFRNKASWIGVLRPTPMSKAYEVEIRYHIGEIPRVFVISPELKKPNTAKSIPHTYSNNEICVYFPNSGEWSADKFIVDTVIPWTILWFFFYEVWLATGTWFGSGIHPVKRTPYIKRKEKSTRLTVTNRNIRECKMKFH